MDTVKKIGFFGRLRSGKYFWNQYQPSKVEGLSETDKTSTQPKVESHNTRKEIAKDLRAQKNAENPTESATQKYPGFYAFCIAVSKKETVQSPSKHVAKAFHGFYPIRVDRTSHRGDKRVT